MLLGFGGRNCWCFKDWMQIDLSLGEGVPADVAMGLPACTAMCFKGANASGKTNALKVYSFIYDFVSNETLSMENIDKILKSLPVEDRLEFIQKLFVRNKRKNRFSIKKF